MRAIEDDPLARNSGEHAAAAPPPGADAENPYFMEVFDQFLALKKSCNESISGLTFAKFRDKLQRNRDELMQKTNCSDVRFTVYVKDGKAALKATPVRDDG